MKKSILFVLACFTMALGLHQASYAALVTTTYEITASDFKDSNLVPPASPTSTSVHGIYMFTFNTNVPLHTGITPDSVTGMDITDNNAVTMDYNETNSGVRTEVNIFTDSARFTIGGNTNSVAAMVGLSNDFGVTFDISLIDYTVTAVPFNLAFVTTVDPFYEGPTTVTLLNATLVPEPAAYRLIAFGLLMLLFISRRNS